MSNKYHHESIARGEETIRRLSNLSLVICGAGALGSNLAVNLARMGATRLKVIDKDRVEERNIGTQVFGMDDVGALKSEILKTIIVRDTGEEVESVSKELTSSNAARLLRGCDLVVDTFDNSASRLLVQETCRAHALSCLHLGVNDQYGEIVWDERYIVPPDDGIDVCDYPLSRSLVMLVAAVGAEAVIRFAAAGERRSFSITLNDLRINPEYA